MDREAWIVVRRALVMVLMYFDKRHGIETGKTVREV